MPEIVPNPASVVPFTLVDKALAGGKDPEPNIHARATVRKGLMALAGGVLTRERVRFIANILHYRRTIPSLTSSDEDAASTIKSLLDEAVFPMDIGQATYGKFSHVPEVDKPLVWQRVLHTAAGQEWMGKNERDVRLRIGNSDLELVLQYRGAEGEGFGGIYIFAKDGSVDNDLGDVPLFEVRGNAVIDGLTRKFEIRAIQNYVSTNMPDASNLARFVRGHENDDENLLLMSRVDHQHNRLINRLLNVTMAEKATIHIEDLVLCMGLAYLKGMGIEEVRGIAHEFQPSTLNGRSRFVPFNYNHLFGRYFDGQDKRPGMAFPWYISATGDTGTPYIRGFNSFPLIMQVVCNQIYAEVFPSANKLGQH